MMDGLDAVAGSAPYGADLEAIRAYYQQSWPDYRYLWFDSGSCALHFGYWDDDTVSHADSLINTNRLMAGAARIAPGEEVLDAGCGIGGTAVGGAAPSPRPQAR